MAKQEKEETKKQDNGLLKNAIVLIAVLVAVGIGYYILTQPPIEIKYDNGETATSAIFTEGLQNANKVFIVMDIRGVASEKQKGNIMQCGTDFAGSSGLVEKELVIYAIEGNSCMNLNSTNLKVNDCLADAISNFAIIINGGSKTTFMKNRAIVGIGEEYEFGECKVNAKYS